MKIRALKALTIRDSETGNLTSIAYGAIAEVSDTLGTSLISDGLAEAYILIAPTGSIEITSNGTVDVAEYASAVVNVPGITPTGSIQITSNGTVDVTEYASAVVNIADFKNCINGTLTQVTASMLNGITSIRDYAFRGYTSLTSINIPEGVTSIGGNAFRGCTSLTSVTIPEGVTSIGFESFRDCTSLTSITIPEGVTSIGASALNGCPIPNLTLPSTLQSVDPSAIYPSVECSLTMLSATPPDGWYVAINYNVTAIYVPAEYVDVYKADANAYADIIHAIPT